MQMPKSRRWKIPLPPSGSLQCELSARQTDPVDCGIFQCPTSDVDIEHLPKSWAIHGVDYDTLTLPCGHHFNVSAIALHFLVSNGRCPVCRQGHDQCMEVNSLPNTVCPAFQKKCDEIKARVEQEESVSILHAIQIDVDEIEQDFCLVVDISVRSQSRLLLQTPIRPVLPYDTGTFVPFRMQQSFQRILNQQLKRFMNVENAVISFSIQHPVMYTPVRTERTALSAFIHPHEYSFRALPFRVQDGAEERVVATVILRQSSEEADMHYLGLFLDRDTIHGLCIMCIQNHIEQLVRQQAD